jgi:hypothetical protein
MPGTGTTAKSFSVGHAGLSMVLVAAGVLALYVFVATTLDVQFLAQAQGEAQAMANAAAAASATELPKGTVAVLSAVSRVLASQKAGSLAACDRDPEIQIGHWDAAGHSFTTGPGKPNAVRVTIRVRNHGELFGPSRNGGEQPIEAQAIAVLEPAGHSLVADNGATTTEAVR